MALTRAFAVIASAILASLTPFTQIHAAPTQPRGQREALAPDGPAMIVPQVRIRRHLPPTEVRVERILAHISINGLLATTTIELTLKNPGATPREAQVLLPVPDGATVKSMQYDGAGVEPAARLLPREEARRIYDSIVNQRRDPALLEFAGFNLVRTSVFPVPPGRAQQVTITYEQVLESDGTRIDYTLPRSQSLEPTGATWEATVSIQSESELATIYSPSHEVAVDRPDDRHAQVRFVGRGLSDPGSLRLSIVVRNKSKSEFWGSVIACPDFDGDPNKGYFMILGGVPDRGRSPVAKREVVLVLDRSGSMRGKKLEQAKAAALQVIDGLHDGEFFNIIDYSDSMASFAEAAVAKSDQSIREAHAYVNRLEANGGTNILSALLEALRPTPAPGALPMVLFLTDGLPTVGERSEVKIRESAEKANTHARRIFAFGVGLDVNAPLLTAVSLHSRGASSFILPNEDVEMKVSQVFRRLDGPVMQSPRLIVSEQDGPASTRFARDVLPAPLPGFFSGDQIVILGRWEGNKKHRLTLEDHVSSGSFTFDLDPASASHRNSYVARLWATRKITSLLDEVHAIGASGGTASHDPRFKELVDEIVALSTKFGILTEYTSFLATEPGAVTDATPTNPFPMSEAPSRARDELEKSSVVNRSGAAGIAQQLNANTQREERRVSGRQVFIAADLKERELGGVQQFADRSLFYRANRWVDSQLLKNENAPPEKTIDFGTPEFSDLVSHLASEGRQGLLARGGEVYLLVQGTRVLARCPDPDSPDSATR